MFLCAANRTKLSSSVHRPSLAMAISVNYSYYCRLHVTKSIPKLLPTYQNPPKNPNQSSFNLFISSQSSHSVTQSLKVSCNEGRLDEAIIALNTLSCNYPSEISTQEVYSSVLDLCANQKAVWQGKQIHARLITSGSIGSDGFLDTKLVFMYGKCGYLSIAQKLFDSMSRRSVFAWNALIGAYISCGYPMETIEVYREMRVSEILPDACTLASVLKACATLNDLDSGVEIHGLGIKCGTISNVFVVNALVTLYAKCGKIGASWKLFESLPDKNDIVSWNSIISASLQEGECSEALGLFRKMQKSGIGMNSYTVVGALQACTELLLPKLGKEIHASMLKYRQEFEKFEANALMVMYARCNCMDDAIRVFKEMHEKDNVAWNSLLSAYVKNEAYNKSISLFMEMQHMGFEPDQVSIISIASALGRLMELRNGMETHAYAVKHGFASDLQVGNTLMDMYIKCSCFDYAERIFRKMPHKDYISWTTAVTGYAQKSCYLEALDLIREVHREGTKVDAMMIGSILLACSGLTCTPLLKQIHGYTIRHGLLDLMLENTIVDVYGNCSEIGYARKVFESISNKDVVSWTSIINCYIQNRLSHEAICMFCRMVEDKLEPDAVALNSILAAAADLSSLMKGKEVHGFLVRRAFIVDGSVGNSLVNMYASCGHLDSCQQIFEMVQHKELVLWTSLVNAYGMHGQGDEAINTFESMLRIGLLPDHVAFLAILYACCHSGRVDEGKKYFDVMKDKYRLEPWPDHYACVVDLLGRSGRVNEAYEFLKAMPVEPTVAAWCALLGACRIHSNREIGGIAAKRLLELEPENPGNYVLVSNVFAAARKWDDVEDIRSKMQESGLRKNPACSWIEIGNMVHSFIARDNSHPESAEIYSKLNEITEHLEKNAGYVGDTSFVLHNVREDEKLKMLYGHSERLAIAYGLISTCEGTTIRISKNLRVCGDCHEFTKLVSKSFQRRIIVRDTNRFHHFEDGMCSCGDFW